MFEHVREDIGLLAEIFGSANEEIGQFIAIRTVDTFVYQSGMRLHAAFGAVKPSLPQLMLVM